MARARVGALVATVAALCGAVACGGQTERTNDESDAGTAAGGSSSTPTPGGPITPLGECKKGPPASNTDFEQPCAWLADKLCYDTKEAACACICPRDRRSTCVSSLPGGPMDRVPVDCY